MLNNLPKASQIVNTEIGVQSQAVELKILSLILVLNDTFHFNQWVFLFVCFCFFKFLAVLGLRFCARAFSSCGKWGPLFIAVRGPLTVPASLVAEHRLQTRRLSNCGSRA